MVRKDLDLFLKFWSLNCGFPGFFGGNGGEKTLGKLGGLIYGGGTQTPDSYKGFRI